MTKLSSSLPKDRDDDGLGSINAELIKDPHEAHVVIAIIDCKSINTEIDTGLQIATARILQIEPLRDDEAAEHARELLQAAQDRRVNRQQLPIVVDGKTGELLEKHFDNKIMSSVTVIGGRE